MKLMKSLLKKILCAAVPALLLVSCDKSDDDTPTNLYQEYEVLVEKGGVSAFANLRKDGGDGERIRVSEGSLTVNTLTMYYTKPETPTDPEYTYFATLASNHTKAVFRFRNSKGKTLVNTAEYSEVPEVSPVVDNLYEVHTGDVIRLKLNGASVNEVEGWLVGSSSLATPISLTITGTLDMSSGEAEILLPSVTPGVYNLVLDVSRAFPVTDGDGTAGGRMLVIRRYRTNLKF